MNVVNREPELAEHNQGVAMKESWQIKQLGEVSEIFDGPHATPKIVDSGPIFLGIGTLQDGFINLEETRHVTPEDFTRWTQRVLPQPDDVVFSYETRIGQAAIIPDGLRCCLGRRMGLVRFKKEIVDPRFFFSNTYPHNTASSLAQRRFAAQLLIESRSKTFHPFQ